MSVCACVGACMCVRVCLCDCLFVLRVCVRDIEIRSERKRGCVFVVFLCVWM